ncbi:MAG: D-alanyl-D-alanine carboxypeptidase, partial [Actinomycetota bacterium]|nr:D-alanyl-D-alanine carboxypeptidase [Actinomycetota bacterium]
MSRPLVAAGSAALVLALAAGAGVGGYAVTSAVRGPQHTGTPRPAAPAALRAAGTGVPEPARTDATPMLPAVPTKVVRTLSSALSAAALGPAVHARIVDLASGAVLLDRGASTPVPPASTAKLFTAAALLSVHK